MPTSTFQEQGTLTLVAWFRPGGARVLGGWPRVTSPSALPAASSARAPLDRVRREKDMAPVFSCDVRFLAGSGVKVQSMESKDSLSPSTTRNTVTRALSHPGPRAEDVLRKKVLVHGKVNRYCHWHRCGREPADKLSEDKSAKK